MKFVSLGIDDTVAQALRVAGMKFESTPFDLTSTFGGASIHVRTRFSLFTSRDVSVPIQEKEIDAFYRLLESCNQTGENIIFFRKTHSFHNHGESARIKDDVEDMVQLDKYLERKYPQLKYHFFIFATCCHCYGGETPRTVLVRENIRVVYMPHCSMFVREGAQEIEKIALCSIFSTFLYNTTSSSSSSFEKEESLRATISA